jgi:DNA-binding MarR family transcriptional regulator
VTVVSETTPEEPLVLRNMSRRDIVRHHVTRKVSEYDRSQVEIHLLRAGEMLLGRLAEIHRAELRSLEGSFTIPQIDT